MRHILSKIGLVYSLFLLSAQGAGEEPRITHFPEAAYCGEPVIFVVEGNTGTRIDVSLNGKALANGAIAGKSVELTFVIPEAGNLEFKHGSASTVFHVLRPGDKAGLVEKDGYLYDGTCPVILLATHTAPPKHDRRWETVKLLSRLFNDTRPVVTSGMLAGASFLSSNEVREVDSLTGTPSGFWTCAEPRKCLGEINGMIAGVADLKQADMAVVSLTAMDQERGIENTRFRIKLEWYLQALSAMNFKYTFVLPPPLDTAEAERFPDLADEIRLLAAGNDMFFVNMGPRSAGGRASVGNWLRPAMDEIKRMVRCESKK